MKKVARLIALLGLTGVAYAGPSTPPAGNYIINVSTIAAKPAFNASSGTVRDQFRLPYISTGSALAVNSFGVVVATTIPSSGGGGSGVTVYPATATASFPFGLSASTVTVSTETISNKLTLSSLSNTALAVNGSGVVISTTITSVVAANGPSYSVQFNSATVITGAGNLTNTGTVITASTTWRNTAGGNGTFFQVNQNYDTGFFATYHSDVVFNVNDLGGTTYDMINFQENSSDRLAFGWTNSLDSSGIGIGALIMNIPTAAYGSSPFVATFGPHSHPGVNPVYLGVGTIATHGVFEVTPQDSQTEPTLALNASGTKLITFRNSVEVASVSANGNFYAPSYWSSGISTFTGVNTSSYTGAGLSSCGDSTHALGWNAGVYSCQSITGTGGGGSSSTLAFSTGSPANSVVVSSPTGNVILDTNTLSGSLVGSTSFFFQVNLSSITAKGNTFNGANQLLLLNSSSLVPNANIDSSSVTKQGPIVSSVAVNSINPNALVSGVYPNINGIGSQSQALNMNTHLINSVVDPSSAQDAATKNYVDNAIVNAIAYKDASRLATTAALPTNIYSNGSSGVGATLTAVSPAALTVDGQAVALGDRILVKNEATQANNGVYTVTTLGTGIVVYVLTRATDFNQSAEVVTGAALFITSGTANTNTGWVMTTTGTVTMGTTAIVFSQFAGPGSIVFQANGTPLTAQSPVNFQNGSAVNGITINMSNPSAGIVQAAISGTLALATGVSGTLQATNFPALTGDITTSAGSLATTLANSGVTASTYGSATVVPVLTIDSKGRITSVSSATITGASGYTTIQDEGTPLTQRSTVNFIGSSIACVDNSGSTRTDCTVTGGGGSAGGSAGQIQFTPDGTTFNGIPGSNVGTSSITISTFSVTVASLTVSGSSTTLTGSTMTLTNASLVMTPMNDPGGVLASGQFYYSSTYNAFVSSMSTFGNIPTTLFTVKSSSNTNTTAAAVPFLSTTDTLGTITLPANWWTVGKTIYMVLVGTQTRTATPTLLPSVTLGGTVVLSTGAITLGAYTSETPGRGWRLQAELTCTSTGASGTFIGTGILDTYGSIAVDSVYTLKPTGTTVDTTAPQALNFNITWGTANALNSWTLMGGHAMTLF